MFLQKQKMYKFIYKCDPRKQAEKVELGEYGNMTISISNQLLHSLDFPEALWNVSDYEVESRAVSNHMPTRTSCQFEACPCGA